MSKIFYTQHTKRFGRDAQQGLTLIELLVTILLVGIVLAAILLNVFSSTKNAIVQKNQSEMFEHGQLALSILSKHIRNAGYEEIYSVSNKAKDREKFGPYLMGCTGYFTGGAPTSSPDKNWNIACNSAGKNDAIAVRYQSGIFSEIPDNNSDFNRLTRAIDCQGNQIAGSQNTYGRGDGGRVTIIDNRFYINNNNELVCWGNGDGSTAAPLVQNIEQLRILYGAAQISTDRGALYLENFASRYLTTSEVITVFGNNKETWNHIRNVRICVVAISNQEVEVGQSNSYRDCLGQTQTPSDRFLRRTLFTTVSIDNVANGV